MLTSVALDTTNIFSINSKRIPFDNMHIPPFHSLFAAFSTRVQLCLLKETKNKKNNFKGGLTSCLSAQAALVWTGSGRDWPWLSRVSNERKARTKLISGSEEARNSRDIDVASPIRPRPSVARTQHTLISSSEKADKISNVSWENK